MSEFLEPSRPRTVAALEQRAADLFKSGATTSPISRTWSILRHYNWLQIATRASNLLRRKLHPSKKIRADLVTYATLQVDDRIQQLAKLTLDHAASHPSHVQVDLEQGDFVLLNHHVKLFDGRSIDKTKLVRQTHLWRFQFHYHEFLLNRVALGHWHQCENFLNVWLDAYAPQKVLVNDDAWHPYCISRRIPAWIWLLYSHRQSSSTNGFSENLVQRLLHSIVQQCEHLKHNLELDLGGNHLLENATALGIAGCAIQCDAAERWRSAAASVLKNQLPRQVLPHGEHFERSPIYHGHMLSNLLRVETCALPTSDLAETVGPFITPMLKHLNSIVHPDGEVPLFADSVFAESPSVRAVFSHAKLSGRTLSEHEADKVKAQGEYQILKNNSVFVICDFGAIAADNLPAHGHCDALNLEASIEGERWIVDSGNYNYSNDSMRNYCRSTIAHNAVTANHRNQATVWDKFRMGQRPHVGDIRHGDDDHWQWASASHDGYRRLGVNQIQRMVAVAENSIACFDKAIFKMGRYKDPLVGYLHFHPEVEVNLCAADPTSRIFEFHLNRSGIVRHLTVCAEDAQIEQGWYCPEFGKRLISPVIRYDLNEIDDCLGWVLHDQELNCQIVSASNSLLITMGTLQPFGWCFSRRAPIHA